jgi:hypothetical protein
MRELKGGTMSAPFEQTPGSGELAPSDFELEFYKAHRAHEVALNNATSAYEQSALRLILVINAAAIPVFLGLIQSADKALIAYDFGRARVAIYSWALGAASAFVATVFGYLSQREFTQAFRCRRQAIEARRVGGAALTATYGVKETTEKLSADADRYRVRARRLQYGVYVFGLLAVLCSAYGFISAVGSIHPVSRSTEPVSQPVEGK